MWSIVNKIDRVMPALSYGYIYSKICFSFVVVHCKLVCCGVKTKWVMGRCLQIAGLRPWIGINVFTILVLQFSQILILGYYTNVKYHFNRGNEKITPLLLFNSFNNNILFYCTLFTCWYWIGKYVNKLQVQNYKFQHFISTT